MTPPAGSERLSRAREHLSAAFQELEKAQGLDELSRYVVATTRGDVQRLIRRLTGAVARQTEPEGPEAA